MRKRIWKEIVYWCQIFLIPLYLLSFLFPRDTKVWVFGSTFGRRFADNPKYFYLYLNQYRSNQVKAIWISKNKEVVRLLHENHLESYYLYSVKGVWYSLRAKVYLYDNYSKDICFTLSGGAIKINLWHGIPLKKIQKDNIFDRVRNPKTKWEKLRCYLRRMSDEKPSDYVLATSQFIKPIFESAFCTKNVLICGYPRNDNLLSEKIKNIYSNQEQEILDLLNQKKVNHKIVVYMPTFRESEANFFDVISMNKFRAFLEEEHIFFCVKLHPKSKLQKKFQEIEGNNILLINNQVDSYLFLNMAEVLVTDYSSIYFDFLLTKKPIVFFAYDLVEYLSDSREMYFEYAKFTPGAIVYYQSELENAIKESQFYEREAKELCEKVFDNGNEFASAQLYSIIERISRT